MSLDLSIVEDAIRGHMGDQPYSLKCEACGAGLTVGTVDVDKELDLNITVDPCQTCIAEAVEEAEENA